MADIAAAVVRQQKEEEELMDDDSDAGSVEVHSSTDNLQVPTQEDLDYDMSAFVDEMLRRMTVKQYKVCGAANVLWGCLSCFGLFVRASEWLFPPCFSLLLD